ncbi:MAG: protein sphX [Candidatus Staskawiczbacteria bacterium RIFCSPLOWO2_01_FULL_38_12b]|uniref:Phosphate-binding protein n=1 Tax=Candidatus Staskawiczbacteria bacterium RIFCSPLOWO2_01_FULL_38_12b TaxID=1802214 RepID=A0A1G2IGT7_9BACT|nr:MAG: protein sphX [Candidatus Staskawiczbacteria bacterium RIFCSPLOWO2_01_FULL_38_12b]
MKKIIISVIVIIVLAVAGFFLWQKTSSPVQNNSIVDVDGSSTVFPITEAMAEEFQKEHENIQVVVGISGTGGGFKRFCRGETHINDASRPIKEAEIQLCLENNIEYLELPIAFDGLAVMVHPSNTWVDYLTVAELKKMWEPSAQDSVLYWDQIRSGWPHKKINLYGAGADSGTYDYFTEAIVGKEGESRGDFVASEDDNVLVQGISSDPLSLGFFGFAYYHENREKLKLIPISKSGSLESAVLPNPETINDGSYSPLSRPIFIYASLKAIEQSAVSEFIDFYLHPSNAQKLVSEVGYVPFTALFYELIGKRFEAKITGSVFEKAGSQTGVTLEQLFSMEEK